MMSCDGAGFMLCVCPCPCMLERRARLAAESKENNPSSHTNNNTAITGTLTVLQREQFEYVSGRVFNKLVRTSHNVTRHLSETSIPSHPIPSRTISIQAPCSCFF